mgnify:CR=1 FL=1
MHLGFLNEFGERPNYASVPGLGKPHTPHLSGNELVVDYPEPIIPQEISKGGNHPFDEPVAVSDLSPEEDHRIQGQGVGDDDVLSSVQREQIRGPICKRILRDGDGPGRLLVDLLAQLFCEAENHWIGHVGRGGVSIVAGDCSQRQGLIVTHSAAP